MKKRLMALCTVFLILSYNMLMTANVCAETRECTKHEYTLTYLDPSSVTCTYSSHPYVIYNGSTGPIYGTCHMHVYNGVQYPQCHICWSVDYSHPQAVHLYTQHDNCGLGIVD